MKPQSKLISHKKSYMYHIRLEGYWHRVIIEEDCLTQEFYDPWEYQHMAAPYTAYSISGFLKHFVVRKRGEIRATKQYYNRV